MEKVNILNQMEQYDFSTPINVTMIFEDSDDDSSFKNILKEQHRNDNNKHKQTRKNIQEKTEKSNSNNVVISETKSAKEALCKENKKDTQRTDTNTSPNDKETKLTEISYSMPDITNDSINLETNSHQSHLNKNNCLLTTNITDSNICEVPSGPPTNESGEINEDVKKLLDIVSENLTLVMMQYHYLYNQSRKSTVAKAAELADKMTKIKTHFFDLSYSTVVSIILPQEKNELFTKKFLEKTVDYANKLLARQCTQRHIEPIYNEMLVWVKQKRNHINSLKDFSDKRNNNVNINDNRLLKERLADPPRHFAHTTINPKDLGVRVYTPNTHDQTMIENNNLCIFSSGTAGNNISISINPDILVQKTRQYFEGIPQNVNNHNGTQNSPNSNIHGRNSPVAPNQAHYDQRFNQFEQNGYPQRPTTNHRPVTSRLPPYHTIHKVVTPTNYRNFQQRNITKNYQTQQNINPTAASININPNLGHTYYPQVEERLNTSPIISQVTSLNPNHSPNLVPFPTHGRCCICGKITTLRCSRCQRFSYCGYLCQELDPGHKTICSHIYRSGNIEQA